MKRKLIVGFLTLCSITTVCPSVYASTEHYTDSSVTGADSGWSDWTSSWADTAADFTKVSLTPGADDTQLNFAWYSEKGDSTATPVVHFGTDKDNLETFEGTAGDVDQELTGDKAYEYNHVTVTGLEPETTYYYTVEKNGQQTDVCEYKTQKTDSVKILYVGDPQIGASKGQTQDGAELTNESGEANTAAENDGFSWNRTLNTALSENPDVNFVISAGDQVNKTGEAKEEEYASYLSADALKSLPVSGFQTKISRVVKGGIDACDFDVMLDKKHENHDHDMEYLHGHHHENTEADTHHHTHENGTDEMHMHSHTQEHTHAHDTESAHGHHHHEHRGLKEIAHMIEHSDMTENAKKTALRIFGILAAAEGKAHNVPADQVHFHEVGAVDSIVDIVSAAVCLDNLEITDVIVPVLHEGCGTVRCQHGILPVPVPAVVNVVNENHLNMKITDVEGELVTPTGAAIAAAIKTKDQLPKEFVIQKTGVGAGKRQYECPGILRAMFIS